MRKLSFFIVCFFLSAAAFAAPDHFAFKKGDVLLGVAVKSATPGLGTDWGEVNVDNQATGISHDAKLGTPSIGAELQVLYFVTHWLALGAAFGDEYFGEDLASGLDMEVTTRLRNYMAVGRAYLNPSGKYRFYIPFGLGAADTRISIDMPHREHFRYRGFATHWGLGVERGVGPRWTAGAEVRYNTNQFHDSKNNSLGQHVVVYPRANYISLLLRAGRRF